jgi:hypothetical protein
MDLISFLIVVAVVLAGGAWYYFTKPTKVEPVDLTSLMSLNVTPVVVEEVTTVAEPVKKARKPRASNTSVKTVAKPAKKKTAKKKTSLKVV